MPAPRREHEGHDGTCRSRGSREAAWLGSIHGSGHVSYARVENGIEKVLESRERGKEA